MFGFLVPWEKSIDFCFLMQDAGTVEYYAGRTHGGGEREIMDLVRPFITLTRILLFSVLGGRPSDGDSAADTRTARTCLVTLSMQ